jgi:hypothetical protein
MKKLVAMVVVLISFGFASAQQHITSPEESFGFGMGVGRKLAGRAQHTAYYGKRRVSLRGFAMKSWTLQFQGRDS